MPNYFSFTELIVAVSLSMDTFSLSLAYGMLGIEKKIIIKISFIVGIFHFIMPLVGNKIGTYFLSMININPSIIIGIIFLILSMQRYNLYLTPPNKYVQIYFSQPQQKVSIHWEQ